MDRTLLHYRLHYLGDLVWEVAKTLENASQRNRELEGKLKNLSRELHMLAPKFPE